MLRKILHLSSVVVLVGFGVSVEAQELSYDNFDSDEFYSVLGESPLWKTI